jgi:hypothetical protein
MYARVCVSYDPALAPAFYSPALAPASCGPALAPTSHGPALAPASLPLPLLMPLPITLVSYNCFFCV